MMKLIPLTAFSVYGVSTYQGRTYEDINGELYVAVDVDDINIENAIVPELLGERDNGEPMDDMAYYDERLESWVKYSEYDEDMYIGEGITGRKIPKGVDNGVGYIYDQLANEDNDRQEWNLFHDPNIHDKRISELGEFGRLRERFLRRWHTGEWAALTVNGELYRHCEEAEKVCLNHIKRLKEKFGNKYSDVKLKEDAKQNIIYTSIGDYQCNVGEDMHVDSDLELPFGFDF